MMNQRVYRPDLLKVIARATVPTPSPSVKQVSPSKDFVGRARRDTQRYQDFTSGNAYVLYMQNRTSFQRFRVQAYGKTPVDAVKRWFRGLDGNDKWKRQCVRVVAVYTCANPNTSQAGDLLMGQAQGSAPW
jgi:hypothetical protein